MTSNCDLNAAEEAMKGRASSRASERASGRAGGHPAAGCSVGNLSSYPIGHGPMAPWEMAHRGIPKSKQNSAEEAWKSAWSHVW